MKDLVICLVGESGSGKTTIANMLEKFGYNVIQSYTTRKPRYKGEYGHIFATVDDFINTPEEEILSFTHFNGNYYWITRDLIAGKGTSIFVVDPKGVSELFNKKDDTFDMFVIYVKTSEEIRKSRMLSRISPSLTYEEKEAEIKRVYSRLENDKKEFSLIYPCNLVVSNEGDIENLVLFLNGVIKELEYNLLSSYRRERNDK